MKSNSKLLCELVQIYSATLNPTETSAIHKENVYCDLERKVDSFLGHNQKNSPEHKHNVYRFMNELDGIQNSKFRDGVYMSSLLGITMCVSFGSASDSPVKTVVYYSMATALATLVGVIRSSPKRRIKNLIHNYSRLLDDVDELQSIALLQTHKNLKGALSQIKGDFPCA